MLSRVVGRQDATVVALEILLSHAVGTGESLVGRDVMWAMRDFLSLCKDFGHHFLLQCSRGFCRKSESLHSILKAHSPKIMLDQEHCLPQKDFVFIFFSLPLNNWLLWTLGKYVKNKVLKENSDWNIPEYSSIGETIMCEHVAHIRYIRHKKGAEEMLCSSTRGNSATSTSLLCSSSLSRESERGVRFGVRFFCSWAPVAG